MAPISGKSAEPAHYKLYGVFYYHGESTGSGHYSVDVPHPSGDGGGGEAWLHIDNEAASTVRHEDVFDDHGNEQVDDRCAYMLFYCCTASAAATRSGLAPLSSAPAHPNWDERSGAKPWLAAQATLSHPDLGYFPLR